MTTAPVAPSQGYRTIVADPPWPLRWDGRPGGAHRNHTPLEYPLMSLDEIQALPVSALAAEDAHLYLWVTPELHRTGVGVQTAVAWGFTPVDEIIWEKPSMGMGAFPRHCHEPLLIARRGSLPFTASRDVRSVQRWQQRYDNKGGKTHSAKPEAALDLIETASPAPRVELFARRNRMGWSTWGNQAIEDVEMPA